MENAAQGGEVTEVDALEQITRRYAVEDAIRRAQFGMKRETIVVEQEQPLR